MNSITEQQTELWGAIENLPFHAYLDIDAASSHKLATLLRRSPLQARHGIDEPSESKTIGSVTHKLLLEPERAKTDILVRPPGANKTSNNNKQALISWLLEVTGLKDPEVPLTDPLGKQCDAKIRILEPELEALEALDKIVCTQEQYDDARRMRASVLSKSIGESIFSDGISELTLLAEINGVRCKGRLDWVIKRHAMIVDVKTALDASLDAFATACGRYWYSLQAAFYRRLYFEVMDSPMPEFIHVVIENKPPYDCAFYQLDDEALESGWRRAEVALKRWKLCEESSIWPGVSYDWNSDSYTIQPLSLPKWAL